MHPAPGPPGFSVPPQAPGPFRAFVGQGISGVPPQGPFVGAPLMMPPPGFPVPPLAPVPIGPGIPGIPPHGMFVGAPPMMPPSNPFSVPPPLLPIHRNETNNIKLTGATVKKIVPNTIKSTSEHHGPKQRTNQPQHQLSGNMQNSAGRNHSSWRSGQKNTSNKDKTYSMSTIAMTENEPTHDDEYFRKLARERIKAKNMSNKEHEEHVISDVSDDELDIKENPIDRVTSINQRHINEGFNYTTKQRDQNQPTQSRTNKDSVGTLGYSRYLDEKRQERSDTTSGIYLLKQMIIYEHSFDNNILVTFLASSIFYILLL